MRKVIRGNVNDSGCYDIRITEENGKDYYYHVLVLEDGESIINSHKPFNIRDEKEIKWEDLSIKAREAHYKKIYPFGLKDVNRRNFFIYGREVALKMKETEDKKKAEKLALDQKLMSFNVDYFTAFAIYNAIGPFEKIENIFDKWGKQRYIVDDKWIVTLRSVNDVSVKEKIEKQRDDKIHFGKHVEEIAKKAGTTYDLATVVGKIKNIDEAIDALKEVNALLMAETVIFNENVNFEAEIKEFFSFRISKQHFEKLNFNKRFIREAVKMLKKK